MAFQEHALAGGGPAGLVRHTRAKQGPVRQYCKPAASGEKGPTQSLGVSDDVTDLGQRLVSLGGDLSAQRLHCDIGRYMATDQKVSIQVWGLNGEMDGDSALHSVISSGRKLRGRALWTRPQIYAGMQSA